MESMKFFVHMELAFLVKMNYHGMFQDYNFLEDPKFELE